MSRRPLIAGNWKMNFDHLEAIAFLQQLKYELFDRSDPVAEIAVVPPFTDLRSVGTLIESDHLPIALGAQDVYWEDSGAFTGEVSPTMLARLRVRYVLCGHSERRQLFGETDEDVRRKVAAVLRHGMAPILCVGETLEQREAGQAADVVLGQLQAALDGVSAGSVGAVVVAYEPVWAIGTGVTATTDEAQEMCALVRSTVGKLYDQAVADGLRVQYGGSVKAGNAAAQLRQPDIDGALVGGASLDVRDFAKICRAPER
jgi:triosephosphate isomerase